jgi:site-specific DNA recombinase
MSQRAAIYARVSTPQQEREATIESQISELRRYAAKQDYELSEAHHFIDQGISGAYLARPGLDRLRDLAAERAFDVALILAPDRLARNYAHQRVVIDELQRVGVQVVFINQPEMGDSPHERLLLGVQGLFAEYERALITERLRRGKLHRIRQGQLVSPNPPYGYRYIPISEVGGGRWEPHSVEAEVVRTIYRWYTSDEPVTISQIVDRLQQRGASAPPRGRRWQFSIVQAILKQSAYTGRAYYNRTRTSHESIGRRKNAGHGLLTTPRHEPRPREEWIEVSVPALVDEDTWQQVQERLAENKRFAARNNKRHFYLLRGLLVCGQCGRTLVGHTRNDKTTYACTNTGKQRNPEVPPHRCSIVGSVIEPLIWQEVERFLNNPTLIADAWLNLKGEPPSQTERERLRWRLGALEKQWTRLLDAFQDGLLEKAELQQRKHRIDQERQAIEHRLQQMAQQEQIKQLRPQMIQDWTTFCNKIRTALESPTQETQQEVIRLLIDHIVVGKDAIIIKHIIPMDDDCRLLPRRTVVKDHTTFAARPPDHSGFGQTDRTHSMKPTPSTERVCVSLLAWTR